MAYPDGHGGCRTDGRGVTTADEAGIGDVAFLRVVIGWSAERHGTVDTLLGPLPDQQPEAAAIVVRTLGGCDLPAGSPVTLHARGPVPAWNQ